LHGRGRLPDRRDGISTRGGQRLRRALPHNLGMDRAIVLDTLRRHTAPLRTRFAVSHLALFGSAARDELRPDSDIDIMVDFEHGPTMEQFFGAQDLLEAALGRKVDLVTRAGLKPRARVQVERDKVDVA
jgi:predicted nucleotidyltransferase